MSGYDPYSRRNVLATTGTAITGGLAGCASFIEEEISDEGKDSSPGNETNTTTQKNGEEEVPEDYTTLEELYEEAERKRIRRGGVASQNAGPITASEIEPMLRSDNSETENVAIAATKASQHTVNREQHNSTSTIRHVLDELELNAYADERAISNSTTITEIYVENDDGSVQKVKVTTVPHNARNPIQYSLISGEEPTTGDGAVADNNLYSMSDPDTTITGSRMSWDYKALENRVEDFGGREEIDEDNWSSAWDTWWSYFNEYLLGSPDRNVLAPTADAWRRIGESERIMLDSHEEAFEYWKEINEEVANRDLGEEEYLKISYNNGDLGFEDIEEYNPGEIHNF